MEGILTVPSLPKEILTVPTVPTITAMPPVVPALQPATLPTNNLGWVYCDIMVGITLFAGQIVSAVRARWRCIALLLLQSVLHCSCCSRSCVHYDLTVGHSLAASQTLGWKVRGRNILQFHPWAKLCL